MITPKIPDGADERSQWMRWANEEIQRLQPIQVRDQRMLTTARGNCDIGITDNLKPNYPPVLQVSDNILQYLFTHYEMGLTVYDGLMFEKAPLKSSPHYILDFASGSNVIHLRIDLVGGVWKLKINDNSDPPFYTGTSSKLLGDYSGDMTNPVDPITVIKRTPQTVQHLLTGSKVESYWIVQTDDAFNTWLKGSSILFSQLQKTIPFTDDAFKNPPGIGTYSYSPEHDFRIADTTFSHGIVLQHNQLAWLSLGPLNWYLVVFQSFSLFPTFGAIYTRDDGDGPFPYGHYSLSSSSGSPAIPPPSGLTISAFSDHAPGAP